MDKEKRHNKIMNKHLIAMHKELGEMYGYPVCCIKQFCLEQKLNILSFQHRCNTFSVDIKEIFGLEYVPCNKCVKRLLDINKKK